MKIVNRMTRTYAMAALLSAAAAMADDAGLKLNAEAKISPEGTGTTLTPPVTITYSGSSPTMTVTTTGSGQGIYSGISNASDSSSALYGTTNGGGAGVAGYNTGTSGPAGKFYVTDSSSAQVAVYATTSGTGNAVSGVVTNASSAAPAVYGQSTSSNHDGIGVQGDGSGVGVYGTGGIGVDGVEGGDIAGIGVQGIATHGTGVNAILDPGVVAVALGIVPAALAANDYSGADAYSYAVYAESANNIAVYGASLSNISARFEGGRDGKGTCSYLGGSGWDCSSDRNLKTNLVPVDADALLEHLAALPMFEYSMKGEQTSARYLGPTAQDFMAAFHLGSDDKLINTANAQGVALAAARQLYQKVRQDEAEIAELKQLLAAQTAQAVAQAEHVAAMEAAFTARIATLELQRDAGSQTVAFRR